jgi:iron(III) transport system substrate-binding protein
MTRKMFGKTVLGVAALCVMVTLNVPLAVAAGDQVNIYSARQEQLIQPLLDRFSAETGIKVNLVTGAADALLKRLEAEGRNSPADIFITTDAGRLHRAKAAGVLQAVKSATLTNIIPASYRDPEGYWYGLSLRARPIMYAKDRVEPSQLSTYENLANAKWKGRICIRSSNNIYNQSLVASLIVADGQAQTQAWLKGFVANFARPPAGGDRDQIKAVAAGQCDIAIANTYYLGGMLNAKDAAQRQAASKVAVFWPNQKGRGAHVNVSGASITKAASHSAAALKLLEFLASESAQEWYAEANYEYPVRASVPWSATVLSWGKFKADPVNLAKLGEFNAEAVKLMDRAGWR